MPTLVIQNKVIKITVEQADKLISDKEINFVLEKNSDGTFKLVDILEEKNE